jgi:hypothetical protein
MAWEVEVGILKKVARVTKNPEQINATQTARVALENGTKNRKHGDQDDGSFET